MYRRYLQGASKSHLKWL